MKGTIDMFHETYLLYTRFDGSTDLHYCGSVQKETVKWQALAVIPPNDMNELFTFILPM